MLLSINIFPLPLDTSWQFRLWQPRTEVRDHLWLAERTHLVPQNSGQTGRAAHWCVMTDASQLMLKSWEVMGRKGSVQGRSGHLLPRRRLLCHDGKQFGSERFTDRAPSSAQTGFIGSCSTVGFKFTLRFHWKAQSGVKKKKSELFHLCSLFHPPGRSAPLICVEKEGDEYLQIINNRRKTIPTTAKVPFS